MALFAVDHDAAPVTALVEAFDVFDAARKYTRFITDDLLSEIKEGEVVEVSPLEVENEGATIGNSVRLEWLKPFVTLKNWRIKDMSYWWRPVDVETGNPITPGKVYGTKDAASEAILHAGFKVMLTTQEYWNNVQDKWCKYAIKRIKIKD